METQKKKRKERIELIREDKWSTRVDSLARAQAPTAFALLDGYDSIEHGLQNVFSCHRMGPKQRRVRAQCIKQRTCSDGSGL